MRDFDLIIIMVSSENAILISLTYWHRACDPDDLIYHPDNAVEFGAHGYPRQLPGLPREMNFSGSSFAAARVTAMAARLIEKNSGHTATELKSALADMANRPGD